MKCAVKEEVTADKKKCDQKCKSSSSEMRKIKKTQRSEVKIAENKITAEKMKKHCSVL